MHRASAQAAAASGVLCEEVMFLFKPLTHFIFGKAMLRGLSVCWSVIAQKVGVQKAPSLPGKGQRVVRGGMAGTPKCTDTTQSLCLAYRGS